MHQLTQPTNQSSYYSHKVFSQSAVSNTRALHTAANVKLPHQQLVGCMPAISDDVKMLMAANSFMEDGQCFDLVDNWSIWKPMLLGCNIHDLFSEDLLSRIINAPLGTNEQSIMLSEMALSVENTLQTMTEEFTKTIYQTALTHGLKVNDSLLEYQKTNFEYDISFETLNGHNYGGYESLGLNLIDRSGVSVIDFDLKDEPLQVQHITHTLINALSYMGLFSWSGELIDIVLGESGNEVIDAIKSHLNSYDLSVINSTIDNIEHDEFKVFLRAEYEEFYEQITEDDPDFDWSYYQLQDCLNYNISFDDNNPYTDRVKGLTPTAVIAFIKDELSCWAHDNNPYTQLPLYKKIMGVIATFHQLAGAHNDNVFEVNSDNYLPQSRVISVDIKGDEELLTALNERAMQAGEDSAFAIKIDQDNALETLKNVALAQTLVILLAS